MVKTVTNKYDINLDYIFDAMTALYSNNSFSIKEIKLYKNIVRSFPKEFQQIYNTRDSQFYETTINIGLSKYNMVWNIDKCSNIIERDRLVPIKFEVNKYKNFFSSSNINHTKLLFANENTDPIIFASYPTVESKIVLIDGNHRFFNSILNNQQTINAYILNANQSIEGMLNETFKTLYKIHYNIMQLGLYQDKLLDKLVFKDLCEYNSLFQLRNNPVQKFISTIRLHKINSYSIYRKN
ncbi:MAG: hypothetical protein K2J01_06635 [Clostridiales bacterium]|nr:hypothetical protein [Clostridiales bacterium]